MSKILTGREALNLLPGTKVRLIYKRMAHEEQEENVDGIATVESVQNDTLSLEFPDGRSYDFAPLSYGLPIDGPARIDTGDYVMEVWEPGPIPADDDFSTFQVVAARNGWSLGTQVDILLEYIENQQSPEAFEDFLRHQQEEESAQDTD